MSTTNPVDDFLEGFKEQVGDRNRVRSALVDRLASLTASVEKAHCDNCKAYLLSEARRYADLIAKVSPNAADVKDV